MTTITKPQAVATVDWLTVTAKSDEARSILSTKAQAAIEDARSKRLKIKPWKWMGYQGWWSEHFRMGARADSDIVILSGSACNCYWQTFVGLGEHCTRIDLAVTYELAKPDQTTLINYWNALDEWRASDTPPRFDWNLRYNSNGGQTLYLQSRQSDQMGRIYDKGLESGDEIIPGKLWRYEVELKTPRSKVMAGALSQVLDGDKVAAVIAGYVFSWFTERRVKPNWPPVENVILLEIEAVASTDESKLKWLTTQVRPSVQSLAERGKLDEVLSALELDGLVSKRDYSLQNGGNNAHPTPR